jgi:ABC-type molybdate transport system substrate-binding protein
MALIRTAWLVLCLTLGSFSFALAETPHIAAASDLKFALEEIATAFRTETQQDVQLSFGSSGNFYRQIEQGAPFTLFLSAAVLFPRHAGQCPCRRRRRVCALG